MSREKKKYRPPPKWSPWENLFYVHPRGIRRSKMVWEGQHHQEYRKGDHPGGWGERLATGVKVLLSPGWGPSSPRVLVEVGSL